jgi:hypothetical protein
MCCTRGGRPASSSGGVAGLGHLGGLNLDWRYKFAVVMLPAFRAHLPCCSRPGRFPKTERAACRHSRERNVRACVTPAFLLWFWRCS